MPEPETETGKTERKPTSRRMPEPGPGKTEIQVGEVGITGDGEDGMKGEGTGNLHIRD